MTKQSTPKLRKMTPSLDLLKPNFTLIKRHYLPLIYLLILPGLVMSLGMLLFSTAIQPNNTIRLPFTAREQIGIALQIVGIVWSLINIGPATYLQVTAADTKKQFTLKTYYKEGLRFSLPLVGLSFLFGIMVLIGLILFIIPGLIALRRYYLAQFYLVDKKLSIKAALQQSAVDSKPYSKAIWGVLGVMFMFQLAAIAIQPIPVIGLVVAELLAFAAIFLSVLRYREITPKSKAS